MPHFASWIAFALVALGMVLTPGPNMIYLVSRSICQGPAARLASLGGVALGFVFYMLCAAFGIIALVIAVPYAYDALRVAGALYLLYLAWQAVRPGGRSPFQAARPAEGQPAAAVRDGPGHEPAQPESGGAVPVAAAAVHRPEARPCASASRSRSASPRSRSASACNATIALAAGSIALFLARRPTWAVVQRWLMATVLAGLAVRMATEARR